MENRKVVDNYDKFLEKLNKRLEYILEYPFGNKGTEYSLISPTLRAQIMQEIKQTLNKDKLTAPQLNVLNHADIDKLVIAMVGEISCGNGNVLTGAGIESSGLAQVYYNCLSMKVLSFMDDALLGTKHIDKSGSLDFLKAGTRRARNYFPKMEKDTRPIWEQELDDRNNTVRYSFVASYDKLNKSFEDNRKKPIIFLFLEEIAKQATPAELQQLQDEAMTPKKSPLVDDLAKHRKQKGIFKTSKDTKRLSAYKKVLMIDESLDEKNDSNNKL